MKTVLFSKISKISIMSLLIISAASCGSSSSSSTSSGGGSTTDTVSTLTGRLTSVGGAPVSGATVAISSGAGGTEYGSASTGADGTYTLSGSIPCGTSVYFTAQKGGLQSALTTTVTCPSDSDGDGQTSDETATLTAVNMNDSTCGFAAGSTEASNCSVDKPRIAVVMGCNYTSMENLLAKLGYADTDEFGQIHYGATSDTDTLEFDLYGGSPGDIPVEESNVLGTRFYDDDTPVAFQDLDELLIDGGLTNYDIVIFEDDVNGPSAASADGCGNGDAYYLSESNIADVTANLESFVEGGGIIFAYGSSYDFIEQTFASDFNFKDPSNVNANDDNTLNESVDDAELGSVYAAIDSTSIYSNATVWDATIRDWLAAVSVADLDYTETYSFGPATPFTCLPQDPSTQTSALNDNGTLLIPLIAAEVVMHDVADEAANLVLTGSYGYGNTPYTSTSTSDNQVPLAAVADHNLGRVAYAVYMPDGFCPTTTFWPSERLVEYLLFYQ